ncbi:hypothetical protein, partial [Chromohalobacter israelensis]|uniref:hypothetical protein n=1 Tax=Chromohalobacter israelensis TaxID=141390 RepID=UPI001C64467A
MRNGRGGDEHDKQAVEGGMPGKESDVLGSVFPFVLTACRVPDDRIAYRSYPLLAARELLQQFIREQIHG